MIKKFSRARMIPLLIICGFIFNVSNVLAEETIPQKNSNTEGENIRQSIVLATVNIYNPEILSQDKNKFTIAFDLSNRVGVQPDIRYGIQLIQAGNDLPVLADEFISQEKLVLGENKTVRKTIQYIAPEYLSGSYRIMIVAKTGTGLPLGVNQVGDVKLEGNGGYLDIKPETCSLSVKDEPGDKKYTLVQGVDVSSDETLLLTCDVENKSEEVVDVKPSFQTFYRTTFGDPVDVSGPMVQSVHFGPMEKQTLTLEIPKPTDPQAYDTRVFLKSQDLSSNMVTVHFVIRGSTASIQSILFDKESYQKDEEAKVSISWSGPADWFPSARGGNPTISAVQWISLGLTDKNGNTCGKDSKVSAVLGLKQDIMIPIIRECQDPIVVVELLDKDEKTLTSLTTGLSNEKNGIVQKSENRESLVSGKVFGILLAFGIFLAALLLILVKNLAGRRGMKIVVFFMVLSGSFNLSLDEAKADTYSASYSDGFAFYSYSYTISLDNTRYAPGSQITAYGSGSFFNACSNGGALGGNVSVKATINGTTKQLYGNSVLDPNPSPLSGRDLFIAQSNPGNYNAVFGVRWHPLQVADDATHYIPYTIDNPVVNGRCGTLPTLCDAGTVNLDSGTACGTTRTWQCAGSNGGRTASCSARNAACPLTLKICSVGCEGGTLMSDNTRRVISGNQDLFACLNRSLACDEASDSAVSAVRWSSNRSTRLRPSIVIGGTTMLLYTGGRATTADVTASLTGYTSAVAKYSLTCQKRCQYPNQDRICPDDTAPGVDVNNCPGSVCGSVAGTKNCNSDWHEVAP